jgi:uncharacterized protein YjiS (DUF1127 family)
MSIVFENRASIIASQLLEPAIRGIGGWYQRAEAHLAANRNRRALYALPDHILKDIGISRGDIRYLTGPDGPGADADPRARERSAKARP